MIYRYAWASIAAALATVGMKLGAYWVTGSVGLLSDALESVVNLVAATLALGMLWWAEQPADEGHPFGHAKAEYFSSGVEGALIVLAAVGIGSAALPRLFAPQPLESLGLGLALAGGASLVNLGVALFLLKAGRKHNSIALEADAHHLLTDVWTSVGVVGGILLVWLTGWLWLDPALALAVAFHIVWTGVQLVKRSTQGLMDAAIPKAEQEAIEQVLEGYRQQGLDFHALRTRRAGSRSFVSLHVLVPGSWTVQRGHELLEQVERDLRAVSPTKVSVLTHLEPLEDPASFRDEQL
ncbi:MAG: transporter [Candidatus Xenobia bacterium]